MRRVRREERRTNTLLSKKKKLVVLYGHKKISTSLFITGLKFYFVVIK
jgi:hypothetical protein